MAFSYIHKIPYIHRERVFITEYISGNDYTALFSFWMLLSLIVFFGAIVYGIVQICELFRLKQESIHLKRYVKIEELVDEDGEEE